MNHTFTLTPPLFDNSKKIVTKVTCDGRDHECKMEMPPCGAGLDVMVRHLHKFTGRARALDAPDVHGRARFLLFRNSLQGSRSAAPMAGWLNVLGAMNFSLTQEQLRITGKAWIAHAATTAERDDQTLCMRTVTKEPTVAVEQLESSLMPTNQLTEWLPGDAPILADAEVKNALFNRAPVIWKEKHRAASASAATDAFVAILSHMQTCEKESNKEAKRKLLKQQSGCNNAHEGQGRVQSSSRGRGRGHNNDHARFRSNNQIEQSKQSKRPSSSSRGW